MKKKDYIKKYIIILITIILVVVADLVTKHFFCDIARTEVIPHLINFETNYGNDGAGFGILSGKMGLLIGLTIFFLVLIVACDLWFKPKSMLYNFAVGFIVGGAVGNLFDRIKFKYVRDFINFSFWESFPTFNLADSFLCVGVVLLSVYLLFFSGSKKENRGD